MTIQTHSDVTVGHFDLDKLEPAILAITLPPDEQQRAQQYRFALDRKHFEHRRKLLRYYLGHSLKHDPHTLDIRYTTLGKPYLKGFPIHFSASSAKNKALIVLANHPIGVDIVTVTNNLDLLTIQTQFYSTAEQHFIRQQADPNHAFFRHWTAKEAYLKATGDGLRALHAAEWLPEDPTNLLNQHWHIQYLPMDNPFVASMVWPKHA